MENETAAMQSAAEAAEENQTAVKQIIDDKIVIRMRKCGRFLLHDCAQEEKTDSRVLLSCLDEREKKELSVLLKKCLNEWKK